jgi:DNA repair exonuclease SbcCD ATPase subunit
MPTEYSQSTETDLDKTDRLPILQDPSAVDDDDGGHDETSVMSPPALAASNPPTDFMRGSAVDLPSLAESVRSVEERIARQNAEYEALTRAYQRSVDAESALANRADALASDLAAARAALEAEQGRTRDLDRTLAERGNAIEGARSRVEEALRESERHQGESRTLRESLAAREATVAQVLHSLGERDAQLAALQAEHARRVPELEATSKSTSQLDAALQAARARATALNDELQAAKQSAAELAERVKRGDTAFHNAQAEITAARTQASSYLERLRTREWRNGFDQNLFREMDAKVGAAHADQGALAAERDRLQSQVVELESKVAAQSESIQKLQEAAAANTATLAQQSNDLKRAEEARARLAAQLNTADTEVARLNSDLALRDRTIVELRERGSSDGKKVAELMEAAKLRQAEQSAQLAQLHAEQAAQIARMQSAAKARDEEMEVLVAHLQEARRPIEVIEADVKRLTEELEGKSAALTSLEEENQKLRATLERTRGALEEREFLIRRLERSESNNANVLGRIQTSIERLGSSTGAPSATAAPAADWSAELIQIDGEHPATHVLSRRTRIGRAAGCEVQIDSTSVSRHHALVMVGPRECIIEDLNSTNGVLVNGRKVTRHMLTDGDAVTIGEIHFRYVARPRHAVAELGPSGTSPQLPAIKG